MPEKWEHMALMTDSEGGKRTFTEVAADGGVTESVNGGLKRSVLALNKLGQDGWHLVSTDEVSVPGYWSRTMWLRRRVT
ncbi:hypothetical protein [Geodermatophilus sp. URMC 64]